MHIERLVIEAGHATYKLDLHRRLTVIVGVGANEREGLINELIVALGQGRNGVHLEIESDAGAHYAIFRPASGRHRVVDIDQSADVTDHFATDAHIDVLRRAGIDPRGARLQLCMTAEDLATRSQQEHNLLTLARIDQSRLWDVADKVKDRERRLAQTAREAGSDADDAIVFAEIERRHHEFEKAQGEHEHVRYLSFVTGVVSALAALAIAALWGALLAVPFLITAVAATAASILYWQRFETARRREATALHAVGATSYLTFQIHRVNGLLGNDHARRLMMRAAEDHRAALAEWRVLVGDIPVDWALGHRKEVMEQARRLRNALGLTNPMASTIVRDEDNAAEMAHALLQRLALLKKIGSGGESFPLLLDDALAGLDSDTKAELLELLNKGSAHQQVVYLTADPEVAAWARVEALTGQLAIVEPAAADATRARRRASLPNHIAV